jgi:ATP-dependent Lhr-like helicase
MYKSGHFVSRHVDPIDPDQIQPNGVDMTLGTVFSQTTPGAIRTDSKKIGDRTELSPGQETGAYDLEPHPAADVLLADVLFALQAGDLEVEVVGGRTAIGTAGRSSGKELLAPENADASVIDTVRERIRDDRVVLACVHCGDWHRRTKVRRVPDEPKCPDCGSTRIAALNPWDEEGLSAIRSNDPDLDEEREDRLRRAHRAANLVQSHGKQAVVALAARGVGPHNAARIIAKLREDEDEFYRDILAREREYARTRSFW